MSNFKETIILSVIGAIALGMWWGYYVIPSDNFRDKVLGCMSERGDTSSEENYRVCISLMAPERP